MTLGTRLHSLSPDQGPQRVCHLNMSQIPVASVMLNVIKSVNQCKKEGGSPPTFSKDELKKLVGENVPDVAPGGKLSDEEEQRALKAIINSQNPNVAPTVPSGGNSSAAVSENMTKPQANENHPRHNARFIQPTVDEWYRSWDEFLELMTEVYAEKYQ
ncbi:uncharacterized protein LOC143830847 [Paroedura picta]|uniref:uncharacterized protein LOC143830847 n=1 Tax=Paroedura picta TaxID=143630 RepID=UPI004055DBAA